jgi:PAS domain S-box-containing protein
MMMMKKVDEELAPIEEIYRNLVENSGAGIVVINTSGKISYVNDAVCSMIGFTKEELLGQSIIRFIYKEDKKRIWKMFLSGLIRPQTNIQPEFRMIHKDSRIVYCRSYSTVFKSNGRIQGFYGILIDISDWKKNEAALIEAKERYQSIFDNPFEVIYFHDFDGNFLDANERALQIFEYSKDEVRLLNISSLLSPDQLEKAFEIIRELRTSSHQSRFMEYRLYNKYGGFVDVETAATVVYHEGKPIGIQGIAHDITERKHMEILLKESEEKYRLLFNELKDAVYVHEVSAEKPGKFVAVNQTACKMLGYTEEEFLQMEVKDIDVPKQAMKIPSIQKKLFETGHVLFETNHLAKDGKIIPVEINIRLFEWQGRSMVLSVARDITERRQIETKLIESESHYRTMFDTMMQGAFYQHADGVLTDVNNAALKMFGLTKDEFLRRKSNSLQWDVIHEDGTLFPVSEHPSMKALTTGKPVMGVVAGVFNPRLQQRIWMEINAIPEFKPNGKRPYQVLVTLHDLSERKKTEEEIKKNETQFTNAAQMARLGPWEYDVINDIFTFNDSFYAIFRTTADEIGGYTMSSADYSKRFVHPEDAHLVGLEVRKAIETNDPNFNRQLEHRIIYSDGEVGYISVRFFIIKDANGRTVRTYGVNQDITDQKKAQDVIKKERDFSKNLIETAQVIILVLDINGKIVSINPYMEKLLGYTSDEVRGKDWFTTYLPRGDLDKIRHIFQNAIKQNLTRGNINSIIAKDGREILIEWYDKTLRDSNGKIIGLLSIGQDITERKKTEQVIENLAKFPLEDPSPILRISKDGTILYANPASTKLLQKWKTTTGGGIPEQWNRLVKKTLASKGIKAEEEEEEEEVDGKIFLFKIVPINDGEYFNVYGIDITNLKEIEHNYKMIFNSSSDAIFIHSPLDMSILDVNDEACRRYGYTKEEMKKLSVNDISSPEYTLKNPRYQKLIKDVTSGKTVSIEWLSKKKSGVLFWQEITGKIIDLNGKTYILAITKDIDARKKAEDLLKQSEQKYRELANSLPQIVYETDEMARLVFVNKASFTLTGYTLNDFEKGLNVPDLIAPIDREKAKLNIQRLLQGIESKNVEYLVFRKDGTTFPALFQSAPIVKNNVVIGFRGFAVDISERKKAEQQLKESEERYKRLFNSIPMAIAETNEDGNFLAINPSMARSIGVSSKDLIGQNVFNVFPKDVVERRVSVARKALKENKIIEDEDTRAGRYFFNTYIPIIHPDGKKTIQSLVRDITNQKKAEEKEKKYLETQLFLSDVTMTLSQLSTKDNVFEFIGEKLVYLTKNTFITIAKYDVQQNKFIVTKLFGYDKYLEIISKIIGKSLVGLELKYENATWKKKFGGGRLLKITEEDFTTIILPQMPRNISKSIKKIINIDQIYVKPLIVDENIFGFVFFTAFKDCTINNKELIETFLNQTSIMLGRLDNAEKIKMQNIELKEYQRELEHQNILLKKADKIKTDFLNVTSHELRTPMSAIKGYVQILLKQTFGQINEDQKQALDVVLRNTNRLDSLIQDILDISRLESGTMKFIIGPINIREMVRESIETIQPYSIEKTITIETEIDDELPEIIADKERIKQVLLNIVHNAIKFSPSGSNVSIRVQKEHNMMVFSIKDVGRGIPKNLQEKIFEIFYQVDSGEDRSFGGAGLGLAISRGIIVALGGKIWVESSLGKGSTFWFAVPIKPVDDVEKRFKEADIFKIG